MPPAYCGDPLHTALKNFRARAYLEDMAKGLSSASLETELPVTTVAVQLLRDKTIAELDRFSGQLGLYMAALRELADPDIAAAQIEAAGHRADALIAAAHETVETERSLRLTAEHTRDTAQRDAQDARGETTRAIARWQESEERAQHQQEEFERQIARRQREHEETLEAIRVEAQNQIERVKQQASKDIALAQAATVAAQEETRAANVRAHDAEVEARLRVESAEQLAASAQDALKREQQEVERLRLERDAQASEARKRLEENRTEIQQLRAEQLAAAEEARRRAEDDRHEIKQLRENLARAIQRADDLADSNGQLLAQLMQIQMAEQEKPEQQE